MRKEAKVAAFETLLRYLTSWLDRSQE